MNGAADVLLRDDDRQEDWVDDLHSDLVCADTKTVKSVIDAPRGYRGADLKAGDGPGS